MSRQRLLRVKGGFRRIFARLHYFLVIIAALLLMAASAAYATTWDISTDFSISGNPYKDWSYGYGYVDNGLEQFSKFTWNDGINLWAIEGNYYGPIPAIWKDSGVVNLHPGYNDNEALAILRWTAPLALTVNISGSFGKGDTNGSMSYYIVYNSDIAHPLFYQPNEPDTYPFLLSNVMVSTGDTIDFVVGPGSSNFGYPWAAGTTPLSATIVPLPGAIWLLGSGLLGLGAVRRFRKG